MSEGKSQAIARVDSQSLLEKAIEKGASIETIERLVALAKDVREVQAREAWHQAMAEFQRRVPPIKKDSTAKVVTMRGQYSYSYAQLGDILEIIRPIMGDLGLSVTWETDMQTNRVVVSCKVSHVLGHTETSGKVSMPIPDDAERGGGNPSQRVGSALTYARRYSLLCVTGLCPEDDDDARGTERRPVTEKVEPNPPKEVTPPPPTQPYPSPAAVAFLEWTDEMDAADSMEKLLDIWKSIQAKNVWAQFSMNQQAVLTETKNRRKAEFQAVGH
jgi:hypothetical protein